MDKNIIQTYCQSKLKERYLIGRNWIGVPITHDILKSTIWIYNTEIKENITVNGINIAFIKFNNIPEADVAESLEWRTIDCLSFAIRCGGIPFEDLMDDLRKAVNTEKLNIILLEIYSHEYGDEKVINMIKKVKIDFEVVKKFKLRSMNKLIQNTQLYQVDN